MKETTRIENYQVEIHRRPRQRTMKMRVVARDHLQVNCNLRMPIREIKAFILESQSFIAKRTFELERKRREHPPKQYVAGETLLFFGRPLPLELVLTWDKRIKLSVLEGTLELRASATSTREERQLGVHRFYKKQAELHFHDRVEFFSRVMALNPKRLSFRGQRTRWGSCSSAGEISFNWKLVAAPFGIIDYVIVHELAHLRHMNHSEAFWRLVERHCPDVAHSRAWLKKNAFAIGQQFSDEA